MLIRLKKSNSVSAASMAGVALILLSFIAYSSPVKLLEADYQDQWCTAEKEVRLADRTRVDCLTDAHAIEIDFANKWKQAIGQSLHYSLVTGKAPGIALIYKKPSDVRYKDQLEKVLAANNLNIKVWVINEREAGRPF